MCVSKPSQQWENFFGIIVLKFVAYLRSMGLDFIIIVPLLQFRCGFSFVLGYGVSFAGEFQCLPSVTVQQLVEILVLWQEKMSSCPSTLPS